MKQVKPNQLIIPDSYCESNGKPLIDSQSLTITFSTNGVQNIALKRTLERATISSTVSAVFLFSFLFLFFNFLLVG